MEDMLVDNGDSHHEGEVAPALIAVDPCGSFVVVAVGSQLRVFNLLGDLLVALADDSNGPQHSDVIRAICFDVNGKLFASAGDDKLVKIWSTDTWHCIRTVCSDKRASAVAISPFGLYICFSDKFGVVWVVDLKQDADNHVSVDKKASPLLGHYCSIITILEFSSDGKFIASADRDFKIRITQFPSNPLLGAHEIQTFCLGHTDFVSCLAFVDPPDCDRGFLVSGSGDSTIRLWDYISGSLLDTCNLGGKVGIMESDTRAEACQAITALCAIKDGLLIAVSIQSLQGMVLISCDYSAKVLSVARVVCIGENFIPTSLATCNSAEYLWLVMGASPVALSDTSASLTRIKAIRGLQQVSSSANSDVVVLEDKEIPGGTKLLETLQGGIDNESHAVALSNAAESLKNAMHSLLVKKQYSLEKREHRKRGRNDRKMK